jgi:hypothetical protein
MVDKTACIELMLSGWNVRDEAALRDIVARALTADIEFCDPDHDIRGRDAFIAMVLAFWAKHPGCTISRASAIDSHHDRARYAWAISLPDGRRFDGFDAAAIDAATGKVRRVDGFFGPLPAFTP